MLKSGSCCASKAADSVTLADVSTGVVDSPGMGVTGSTDGVQGTGTEAGVMGTMGTEVDDTGTQGSDVDDTDTMGTEADETGTMGTEADETGTMGTKADETGTMGTEADETGTMVPSPAIRSCSTLEDRVLMLGLQVGIGEDGKFTPRLISVGEVLAWSVLGPISARLRLSSK